MKKSEKKKEKVEFIFDNKKEVEVLKDDVHLIQTKSITIQYKAKVYYCSLDGGENYIYTLKELFKIKMK